MLVTSSQVNRFALQVDGQTSGSWDQILSQFADASIYQTWAYGAVRWGVRSLSHVVLRRNETIVAAAQIRIARLPFLRAGIAYLRWGPLCQSKQTPLDPEAVAAIIRYLKSEYVERRGLALHIIPNAFSREDRAAAILSAFHRSGLKPETSLGHYRTFLVDLSLPVELIRKRLDQKWRNQLNRAEKSDLLLEVSDRAEAYREFLQLYQAMQERKPFETTVDVEEFARIQALLSGPARMRTFLAKTEGCAIGALVCCLLGDTAIYLLGATNERARELKAAYFLHWQAILWLKNHGARRYDLGGIDPEANPGGYHFKSGFGGEEVTQSVPHAFSSRGLSQAVIRGIAWLRSRQNSPPALSPANS